MQCKEEDRRRFSKPEKYDNVVAVFDEICEEGTVLNEIVTSNLKCFNETFSNTNCPQEIYAFSDSTEKKYRSAEPTTTNLNDENTSCMSMILLANCIVKDVTIKCGIRARFMMSELVQRTHFIDSACPLSYRKSLLQFIDEFDLTEEQKIFATAELVRMEISE
ncbi:unnamed protein product [Larinioides sclopetarius]|uniref:Uncharacterized protein n=1 Tax=Larinioides sclopetarius TaxID=280406 RepID=A0AAV2BMZ7_9ARAC